MEKHTKCDECGAYPHEDGTERHGWVAGGNCTPCSKMSPQEIKANMIAYFKEYQKTAQKINEERSRSQLRVNKFSNEAEFWKGKYNTVRIENNKLRKNNNI